MTLSNPDVEKFVDQQVRSGAYPSADAVLEAAVMSLMAGVAEDDAPTDEDWVAIAEARAEAARGEGVKFADFMADVRAELNAR